MIGKNNPKAKFILLQDGDIMHKGDEYYNNFEDKWLPVTDGEKDGEGNYPDAQIGYEFSSEESKPVRRKNLKYKG